MNDKAELLKKLKALADRGYRRRKTERYTASGRSCRTIIGADVTAAQKIEIEFLFDFYIQQYTKERKMFLEAFIQKHELFGQLKPGEEAREMTLEEIIKLRSLINGMESVSPVRRLEAAATNE